MPQPDRSDNKRPRKTLRVLFVMGALDGGGAEKMVTELLGCLDRNRIQPSLFLTWHRGVHLKNVPSDVRLTWGLEDNQLVRKHVPSFLARLMVAVRNSDVVVGGVELLPSYFAWLGAAIGGKPVVGWIHTDLRNYLQHEPATIRRLTPLLYPRFDKLVAVTPPALQSVQQVAVLAKERLQVIPNFIDAEKVRKSSLEPLPPWAGELADRPFFIGLGRLLNREKGFDLLIRAHAQLRDSGANSNLVILGEGPDRSVLEKLVCDLGVSDSVFLPGFDLNPFPVLHRAVALVAPSRIEGLPVTLLEAMSLGVPVIASGDCPGVAWVVGDGAHGVAVSGEDHAVWASEMRQMMLCSARRQEYSSRGVNRSKDFAPDSIIEKWESLFDSLAGNRPGDYVRSQSDKL